MMCADTVCLQQRAGGHDTLIAKPIDISAFSFSKRTTKAAPTGFLKRGTGMGGTLVSNVYIVQHM
jgi:hypothetical protein